MAGVNIDGAPNSSTNPWGTAATSATGALIGIGIGQSIGGPLGMGVGGIAGAFGGAIVSEVVGQVPALVEGYAQEVANQNVAPDFSSQVGQMAPTSDLGAPAVDDGTASAAPSAPDSSLDGPASPMGAIVADTASVDLSNVDGPLGGSDFASAGVDFSGSDWGFTFGGGADGSAGDGGYGGDGGFGT